MSETKRKKCTTNTSHKDRPRGCPRLVPAVGALRAGRRGNTELPRSFSINATLTFLQGGLKSSKINEKNIFSSAW
ncbi:MAG: hypothetical protein ACOX1X_10880 [Dethiobacteria bacterium]